MSNIFTADPNRFIPAGANGGVPGPPNGGGMFGMIASNGLLPPPMPPAPPIQLEMPPALSGAKKPRDIHSLLREGMKAQPRACGVPIAKRSLAELKADEKKTGIKVRDDLPPDFPRGPWVADLSKPPDHAPASGCHDGGQLISPYPSLTALACHRPRIVLPFTTLTLCCGTTRMEVPRGADGGAMEVLVLGSQHAARLPWP
jgi:hypothetical protein